MSRDIAQAELNRINAQLKANKPDTPEEFGRLASGRVTSNDSGWFGRGEAIGGVGNNQVLEQWAFAAKPGDVTDRPIGTNRGPVIAYLEASRPAGVATLADVRERVEQDVKRQKAAEAARARLAQLMAGAPNVDALAAQGTRPPQEATVAHQGSVPGLSDTAAFTDAALKAAVGRVHGPVVVGEGAVAFQVLEQKRVTPEELAKNRAALADRLRQQQARQLRSVLVERLRKTAEIEINDEITRPTTPAPTPTAGL